MKKQAKRSLLISLALFTMSGSAAAEIGSTTFEEAERFEITFSEYEQADKDHSGEVDMEEFISASTNSTFRNADLNHNNTIEHSGFQQDQYNYS